MSTTFKNARGVLTTSLADIYTCPALTTAVVLNIHISNISATTSRAVSINWTDASNSNVVTRLASTMVIPASEALALLNGKLVLEAGDKLQGLASATVDCEVSIAIMEIA